jgi:hypothetical protein
MKGDRYTITKGTSKAYRIIPASGYPEHMEMDETGLYAWLHSRCGYSDAQALHAIAEVDAHGSTGVEAL